MTDYLSKSPLGKKVAFSSSYDPSVLCPIPRAPARRELGINPDHPPFSGEDVWNLWELSWLSSSGKPEVAVLELTIPAASLFIVESKSLKLYLNSLNMTRFSSGAELKNTIVQDVSKAVGASILARLFMPESFFRLTPAAPEGNSIDNPGSWAPQSGEILEVENKIVSEEIYSNLLRTICPVTGQPDWATISVRYTGKKILWASLLNYFISLREHAGFHENCVEMIFWKIFRECGPEKLMVKARFTRRGGIDINPFRTTEPESAPNLRDFRQ